MNPWDIVILAAIAAAVFLAIRSIRNKKKHTGCDGACAFCAGCSAGNKEDTKS